MCSDAGAIVGPIVAGLLADRFSYAWAFGLGAALLVVAATYSLRMPRGLPPDRNPPAPSEPAAEAEPTPLGEQQIGGPEADDPTTKDLR